MQLYATVSRVYGSVADMPASSKTRVGVCYATDDCGLYYYDETNSVWTLDSYMYEPVGGEVMFAYSENCYYRYNGSEWLKLPVVVNSASLGMSEFDFHDEQNILVHSSSLGMSEFDFHNEHNILVHSVSMEFRGKDDGNIDVIGFGME